MKEITNIGSDIDTIISQEKLNLNRFEVLNTLFLVDEIFTGEIKQIKENDEGSLEFFEQKSDKQPETTNMPDSENEESQQGQGLKILTPNQMLSRLPISLAQLKEGNNSEKHKNKIRQLFYSLYRSKKLTKELYKGII